MGVFETDGGQGSVTPVYIKIKGNSLLQIFPLTYNQKDSCALLGSPSEAGLEQLDNKVIQPIYVQFTGIVKWSERDVFLAIRENLREHDLQEIKCEFQTKADAVKNMLIESIEEIGESNRYDGMEIRVCLKEFLEHSLG